MASKLAGWQFTSKHAVVEQLHGFDIEDIANWMAERVARHKRLMGGVVILDEIPKNPSGKILRKNLRERAAKEVGDSKEGRESKM